MKKSILVVLSLILGLIIVGCQRNNEDDLTVHTLSGDYPHFESINTVTQSSGDIIRGKVLDTRVEKINVWREPENELEDTGMELSELEDVNFIFTIYTLEVLEVFKGDAQVGDTIEIMQLGGQIDSLVFINNDEINISLNDDLILFLGDSVEGEPSMLLNPIQAAYYYNDEISKSLETELESVNPQNDLVLTMNDLLEIKE